MFMCDSPRYIRIVEWSDEDQCFVGQCPGIIGPCCHGSNEAEVYAQLRGIVEEWIETLKRDGKPLPPLAVILLTKSLRLAMRILIRITFTTAPSSPQTQTSN